MLCSCAQKGPQSPVEAALEAAAIEKLGEPGKFELFSLEKVDSSTFRDEFEKRTYVFNLRIEKNEEMMLNYQSQGKPRNAAAKREAVEKDRAILQRLEAKRQEMADRLDEIAFYDYRFSGCASAKGKVLNFKDAYFTITPANGILTMSTDKDKVHRATGMVIPGYYEILGRDSEADTE